MQAAGRKLNPMYDEKSRPSNEHFCTRTACVKRARLEQHRPSYLHAVPGIRAHRELVQGVASCPGQVERRTPCVGRRCEYALPLFAHEVELPLQQFSRRQEAEHDAKRIAAREVLRLVDTPSIRRPGARERIHHRSTHLACHANSGASLSARNGDRDNMCDAPSRLYVGVGTPTATGVYIHVQRCGRQWPQ